MRPLKLSITGFGTYCNPTVIDFEKFGNSGLYLITGDTGAGKTTIFDAITFALYGVVNGQNRSVNMIRSTMATPETPTEVELSFEYRGQIYTVKRNPEYTRKAKRGEALTKQQADATLILPDNSVVTQYTKVTAAIVELLRLDVNQFSQIVMIAQGDFQKLLMEGTDKRQEIFRKIFKTDFYQTLQNRLGDEEKKLRGICGSLRQALEIHIKNIFCDEADTDFIKLEKAKAGKLPVAEETELIESIISKDEKAVEALKASMAENSKKLEEITGLIGKYEKIQETGKTLEENNKKLAVFEEEKKNAALVFEEKKALEIEADENEKKAVLMEQKLSDYDELNSKQMLFEKETAACQMLEKELKVLAEVIKTLSEEKENCSKELKELSEANVKVSELENKKEKLLDKKNLLDKLGKDLKEAEKLSCELTQQQEDYRKAMEEARKKDDDFKEKRCNYMNEQAGILASELKENVPCPVCGSVHHPYPAAKSTMAPTEAQLNKAEKDAVSAAKLAEQKSLACSVTRTRLETAQNLIKQSAEKILENSVFENIPAMLEQERESLEAQLNQLEKDIQEENRRISRKMQLEEKLPEYEKNVKIKEEELSQKTIEQTRSKSLIQQYKDSTEELKKKLEYESKAKAEKALYSLKNEITEFRNDYEKARNCLDKAEKNISEIKAQNVLLTSQLKDSESIDIDTCKNDKALLDEEKQALNDSYSKVYSRLSRNKDEYGSIKENIDRLCQAENKYVWVNSLSKTANGDLGSGKEKIKLETYIQMTYFDRILRHANKRLMVMSSNQYELVRSREAENLRSQTGLEIDVIDHYNGGRRSVKSLSGGESFEASLALALGLSDEIRQSAGGIQIDSMFVDEGFGTLDSDTLQQAYAALSGITEGNRLVGIISHVEYLRNRIDNQIVVKKERSGGSSVSLKLQ